MEQSKRGLQQEMAERARLVGGEAGGDMRAMAEELGEAGQGAAASGSRPRSRGGGKLDAKLKQLKAAKAPEAQAGPSDGAAEEDPVDEEERLKRRAMGAVEEAERQREEKMAVLQKVAHGLMTRFTRVFVYTSQVCALAQGLGVCDQGLKTPERTTTSDLGIDI